MLRWTISVILVFLASLASAGWPQFGGPERNFRLAARELPAELGTPLRLWERNLGPGYAGIVSDGVRLVTMTREGDREIVVALDSGSGRTLWRHAYPAPVESDPSSPVDTTWGSGPNGTPLLAEGRVYTLGFTGALRCLDVATGRLVWSRDLVAQDGLMVPFFGLSTSPIRYGDAVIVIANGAHAFDLESGTLLWHNSEFTGSYASPVLLATDAGTQLVVAAAGEVVGLDADGGQLLWRHAHANDYRTILSSPVVGDDDVVFVSAYFLGSIALRLGSEFAPVVELWESPDLQISYTNSIRDGDTIFGFHNSILRAIDLKSGEMLWQSREVERGNLIQVGDRYLALGRNGELSFVSLDRSGVTVHGSAQILEGRSWTAPTLVGSTLYARNLEKIVAFDLDRQADAPRIAERPVREPVVAPEDFLAAKESLMAAYRAADAESLAAGRRSFERWTEATPELRSLAHYYVGFAAYNEALLTEVSGRLELVRSAEEALKSAVALDRRFADAHALLARIYPMYYRLDPRRGAVAGPLGGEHHTTATRLAPDNPRVVAFAARSRFYRSPEHGGSREDGLEQMRRALELLETEERMASRAEPDWGHGTLWLWYGEMLNAVEEGGDEALAAFRKALEATPDLRTAIERVRSLEAGQPASG